MYATKLKMRQGCRNSQDLLEIDAVFIEGCASPGFYKKESLHDYLKENPNSIQVKIPPYPYVIPATSAYGEKYVRSAPNASTHDNLLDLPRV
ncbi:MAG: DUF3892 domain-containing protein [Clostridia bacterium]